MSTWRPILTPFPWESALSGIHRQLPTRTAWYRRTFTVPADWNSSRVLLNFGAVDWHARVLVNGRPVGEHRGGYDAWTWDRKQRTEQVHTGVLTQLYLDVTTAAEHELMVSIR